MKPYVAHTKIVQSATQKQRGYRNKQSKTVVTNLQTLDDGVQLRLVVDEFGPFGDSAHAPVGVDTFARRPHVYKPSVEETRLLHHDGDVAHQRAQVVEGISQEDDIRVCMQNRVAVLQRHQDHVRPVVHLAYEVPTAVLASVTGGAVQLVHVTRK